MARTKRTERSAPGPSQLQPGSPPLSSHPLPPPADAEQPDPSALPPTWPTMAKDHSDPVVDHEDDSGEPSAARPGANPQPAPTSTKRSRKSRSSVTSVTPVATAAATAASPKRRAKYNYTSDKNKPFCCDHCNPKLYFGRKHDLKRHMDTKHLNDRPFQCPRPGCGHASNRRDHARRHLKSHTICADYVRKHHATDESVAAAVEQTFGAGGSAGGSDAWMSELGFDAVTVDSNVSEAEATTNTVELSGVKEDAKGQAGGGEDGSSDGGQSNRLLMIPGSAATTATGMQLPDPQLFFTAAHAAESPPQAPLQSPFASASMLPPMAPSNAATIQQQPLAGPPFPPMRPTNQSAYSTVIPPHQILPPLPFYQNPFHQQALPTNPSVIPTPFYASTPAMYQPPHWPVSVANPAPTNQPASSFRGPISLAPAASSAAGSNADPSQESAQRR